MLNDIVLGKNVKITNLGEAVFADSRCISNESVASILNNYAANSAETENIAGRGDVKYIPAYLFSLVFKVKAITILANCILTH